MNLKGQTVATYCEAVKLSRYAVIRLKEIYGLKTETFHEDRFIKRALSGRITEARENLVAAVPPGKGPTSIFVVDLATCTVVTVFRYKKSLKVFKEGESLIL